MFYIMQDKVWAGLFRRFAEVKPTPVKNDEWSKFKTNDKPRNPVLGVAVEDAQRFAQWLGGSRANLPTRDQWDRAAGRFDKGSALGPFLGQGDKNGIAIARTEPREVGTSPQDVSRHECRDMAGNGSEWTRDVAGLQTRFVPLPNPTPDDLVCLRGRSYRKSSPLLFEHLNDPRGLQLENCPYLEVSPVIGFRVVIEP